MIPAELRIVVTGRLKLACRACPGIVLQEHAPARLIEGCMLIEATVAHVPVSRYADHLPLYRQSQIMAWHRIEIGREVLGLGDRARRPALGRGRHAGSGVP